MKHITILVILLGTTLSVASANGFGTSMSMARHKYYSRTQYLLPCDICIKALQYQSYTPSHNVNQFTSKIKEACHHSTKEVFQQQACIAILTKYSYPLLKDQMKGLSFHKSCVSTFATNCVKNDADFTVYCDQHKKTHCRVIIV